MDDKNTAHDYEVCLRILRMAGGDDPTQSVSEVVAVLKVRICQLNAERDRIERETYQRQVEQEQRQERVSE